MDLPEPDRQILKPAPVHRVICQLQFDSSEQVASSQLGKAWAGELADDLPRFAQLQGEVVTIQGSPDQPIPLLSRNQERGWRFADDEDDTVVTLVPGSVALETSTYRSWEEFSAMFTRLVHLVGKTVDPAVEQRLGLRYINELASAPKVSKQVDPPVLGLRAHEVVGDSVRRVEQRVLVELDNRLMASVRFLSAGADKASRLDIDVYRELGRPFAEDEVLETLTMLNSRALSLFQACLDDDYLASLKAGRGNL